MAAQITSTRHPKRLFVVAALGAASLLLTGACGGGEGKVAKSDVESEVATQLAASTNQPKPTVDCPGPLTAKVGASIDCELTAQGDTTKLPVHVVVESVSDGTAHFSAEVGKAP